MHTNDNHSLASALGRSQLNLGCGTDIRAGWLNVDLIQLPGVDLVMNVEELPWPFNDGMFEVILAKDVLEHCQRPLELLAEMRRILKPGGIARIQVPHFTSRGAFLDPTHVRAFSFESFHFVTRGHPRSYYIAEPFAEILSSRITFDRDRKLFWNRLLEPLVNWNLRLQRAYEQTPLRLFPALNVEVELRR